MDTLFAPIAFTFSALRSFSSTLSSQFEQLTSHPKGLFAIAAIVVTSLVLAFACGTWAIVERARRGNYRERVQAVLRRSQIARHFRDTILDSLPEAVVVLRSKSQQALSYGGGSALLQQCLDGPNATPLAVAIDDLLRHASGFSLSVQMSSLQQIFVRGLRIGNGAALFLRAQERYGATETVSSGKPRIVRRLSPSSLGCEPRAAVSAGNIQSAMASRGKGIIIETDGRHKRRHSA